ncbi:MAG: hypothetical protein WAS21_03105 [Geminicoccaceae bacterium]
MLRVTPIRTPARASDHLARLHRYGGEAPPITALFDVGAAARGLSEPVDGAHLEARGLSRATANIIQRERATWQARAARPRLPGEQQRQADRARTRQAGFDLEAFGADICHRTARLPASLPALHTKGR